MRAASAYTRVGKVDNCGIKMKQDTTKGQNLNGSQNIALKIPTKQAGVQDTFCECQNEAL